MVQHTEIFTRAYHILVEAGKTTWTHLTYSPAAEGQKVEVEYVQTFIAVS